MPYRSIAVFKLAAVAFLLPLLGCGGDGPALVPVEGKVTLDGVPLPKGSVRLQPDKAKGNTFGSEPVGEIVADGSFKIMVNGKSGAPVGWYKVGVNGAGSEIPDSTKPLANKSPVAVRFADPATSNLSVEVVPAAAAGAYDFKVSAK